MLKTVTIVPICVLVLVTIVASRIDTTGFTDDEYGKLLKELVETEKENLTPAEKLDLRLKLDKLRGIVKAHCPYFNLNRNMTSFIVEAYNCGEAFIGAEDWEDLTAEEYVSAFCDRDNWAEYMECAIPVKRRFISALFQCYLGEEWIKPVVPGGLVDNIQYIFQLFPKLLNSFWEMTCANKQSFLKESFVLRNEVTQIKEIFRKQIFLKDEKERLRMGFCILRSRQDKSISDDKELSVCSFASATYDLNAVYKCVMDGFRSDPIASELLKKTFPTLQFILDKNTGGSTKIAFQNLLWTEFCTEKGQLSHFFKPKSDTEFKLKEATQKIGLLKNELENTKTKLNVAINLISNMEAEFRKSKFRGSDELQRDIKRFKDEL